MSEQEIFGVLSLAAIIFNTSWYLYKMRTGQIRGHAFSWLLWGVLMMIAAPAMYLDNAGPGAWSISVGAILCLIIAAVSARKGLGYVTRFDWGCLALGIAAIPVWILTGNALYSVLMVTSIDGVGYLPSIRKAWALPYEESLLIWLVNIVGNISTLLAIENYTLITTTYHVMMLVMNSILASVVLYRRTVLGKNKECV